MSERYRFVAALAAFLLVVIFTARAARIMWQEQRDRAEVAEAAFKEGALTARPQPLVGRAETVNFTINVGPSALPELLGGLPPGAMPGQVLEALEEGDPPDLPAADSPAPTDEPSSG